MLREKRLIKTSTSTIEGREIKSYITVVAAEIVVRHPLIARLDDAEAGPRNGRQEDVEEIVRHGRKDATARLERKAMAVKADAVVDLKFDYRFFGSASVLFSASGTAVELK